MSQLLKVSLRQQAVYIPQQALVGQHTEMRETTLMLAANLAKLGFGVSEPLLLALNHTTPAFQVSLLEKFRDVMGVKKNWTPLVKGWDTPTGEKFTDHIMTFFANIFGASGTRLQCGHLIPPGTFPLERYNGCPFCGTPFEFGKLEKIGQGSKLKVLELWREKNVEAFLEDLLTSKTALDATQIDSLKMLLAELPLPQVSVGMKETLMTVIDICVAQQQPEKVQALFTSPTDILRYLWYKHTGFLQIIEPRTIIQRKKHNSQSLLPTDSVLDDMAELFAGKYKKVNQSGILGKAVEELTAMIKLQKTSATTSAAAKLSATAELKLKYSRKESVTVAKWLNGLEMQPEQMCEIMHPKRGMWVRFIRALRLAEYSKRPGFEKLKTMMDLFYNELYEVWQGRVNYYRLRADMDNTLKLLKQRPGLFARSLFANMLWFGKEPVVAAFAEIIDKVPARLVFTLNMYAETYFNKRNNRTVKPLGGIAKHLPPNKLMTMYNDDQLEGMKEAIAELCLVAMTKRFAAIENPNKTIFIDPMLFKIPVSIGDRSSSVQDLPSALMGTRFPIEGNTVRLFMQWGSGLPAQHMDMDLSCHIAFSDHRSEICSYSRLEATGCKHSGDIRSIPDKVGTAEYIEINVDQLSAAKAKYVTFTSNAFSNGAITPNLVIGWMNSKFPMKISEKTGVAYDPSCVQHQVRVVNSLDKGLVFGVLDVENREVIWLELPFGGQVIQGFDTRNIETMLRKLEGKLTVGNLLKIKAEAQGMEMLETADADEVYSREWAMNTAAVTKLLVD